MLGYLVAHSGRWLGSLYPFGQASQGLAAGRPGVGIGRRLGQAYFGPLAAGRNSGQKPDLPWAGFAVDS
jgi:hypothetical protein